MAKIDIIVAVHNGEGTIKKCVESLLRTSYREKRIIIVNDGSTDGTEKILEQFGDKILVLKKSKGGVSEARNYGISQSDAEFIGMTDADCEVDHLWLDYAIGYFENPNVGAVTGWLHYRATNFLSAVREAEYFVRFERRQKEAYSVSCPVALFRKKALEEAGYFDTIYTVGGEDTDVGYKISEKGYKVIYEREMVAFHEPEEKLSIYLKRNYRNARNHTQVLLRRKKRNPFFDDFFPWTLRLQPVFTLLFLAVFPPYILLRNFFFLMVGAASGFFIFFNFLPVISRVVRMKGIFSIPISFCILTLRNLVWLAGLFAAIVGVKK